MAKDTIKADDQGAVADPAVVDVPALPSAIRIAEQHVFFLNGNLISRDAGDLISDPAEIAYFVERQANFGTV